MPWDIYLDWLQDQGNEDLRGIDFALFNSGEFLYKSWNNYGYWDEKGDGGTLRSGLCFPGFFYGLSDGSALNLEDHGSGSTK